MNSSGTTKRLEQPSKILCSSVNEGVFKLPNDIAPVHTSVSRVITSGNFGNSSSFTAGMDAKQRGIPVDKDSVPCAMASQSISQQNPQQPGISEVSSDFRDKLNFRNTNGVMNGMRMGTTDVEVHYSSLNATSNNSSQSTSASAHTSGNGSVRSKVTPLNNIANSSIFSNCKKDNTSLSPPHEPPPPPPFQDLPPLSPPHEPPPPPPCEEPGGYPYFRSVASRAIGADSPCSSKSSHDGGTGVCNGHTVSEATSNTSIAASSEFSISSERSSDSSLSGVRARTRHTSNSSSQSTQPRSDVDLSLASDILKTPEISNSPLPNSVSDELQVEYVNYESETQMGAIMSLIQKDLSEPYSIYTYRYFIHNWPHLCFLVSLQ